MPTCLAATSRPRPRWSTREGADLLIGFGGSSVTDATKIVAVRAASAPIRQVHVPTTLSSGEWTPASGMIGDQPGTKTYVVDPAMAPFAIVLDPELTLTTPASCGSPPA